MLRKFLADIIKIDGPISVAKYMQIALTHPTHGYYTGKEEVLGKAGDFTTSPEISQLFGETVGIAMLDWARHRRQQPVDRPLRLIELGPGKGTLMHDILGTTRQFPDIKVERCDLVEVSQRLKQKQSGLLTGAFPNTPFHWHSSLDQLGSIGDLDLVLIAHEFFDALPVHAFKRLDNGWREILVDYHPASDQFRLITSYGETLIQQVLQIDESKFPAQQFPPGSTIELSPEGLRVAERIRDLMSGHPSSLSLIIDYGQRTPPSFSLRAIRDHHIVPSMFDSIGKADLSADVDFGGLQEVFTKTRSRQFRANFDFQGQFLQKFGIRERALGLCRSNRGNKCAIDHIQSSYDRLVSPTQMGSVYKVLQLEC